MRKVLICLVGLPMLTTGCLDHAARTGWRFEVLKPPTIASEALVESTGHQLSIRGNGIGGLRSEIAGVTSFGGLPPGVTVEQVEADRASLFFLLRSIQDRLGVLEREVLPKMPPPKTAPKGSGCPG